MNRRLYLRQWLRAMTVFERRLLGPTARERNRFIKAASAAYQAGQGIPNYILTRHREQLKPLLFNHYIAVMPIFGAMAVKPAQKRRKRFEVKRVTFLSKMQEWAATRALAYANSIADTDIEDVRRAIQIGLDDGLGTEDIGRSIRDVTQLTPYRAATVARTETHAAATFGAIEEARQTSEEIGIKLVKSWLPTLDDRTRADHAAMDGTDPIPLDELFIVGGVPMDRPGDPSAPPSQICNCRCALSVVEQTT